MNQVAELVQTVLGAIRNQWYADRTREFKRDERTLMQAIAHWGFECDERGWDFSAAQIQRHLLDLLNQIKRQGGDITYQPVYLNGAVKRWIGLHAEELQDEQQSTRKRVAKVVSGVQPVVIKEPTAVETLGLLYRDLRHRKCRKGNARPTAKQPNLF